jgi:hypothetical protein
MMTGLHLEKHKSDSNFNKENGPAQWKVGRDQKMGPLDPIGTLARNGQIRRAR